MAAVVQAQLPAVPAQPNIRTFTAQAYEHDWIHDILPTYDISHPSMAGLWDVSAAHQLGLIVATRIIQYFATSGWDTQYEHRLWRMHRINTATAPLFCHDHANPHGNPSVNSWVGTRVRQEFPINEGFTNKIVRKNGVS